MVGPQTEKARWPSCERWQHEMLSLKASLKLQPNGTVQSITSIITIIISIIIITITIIIRSNFNQHCKHPTNGLKTLKAQSVK